MPEARQPPDLDPRKELSHIMSLLTAKQAHSHVLTGTQDAETWIHLLVDAPPAQTADRDRPGIDIALVIDCSGSMGNGPGSPLDYARRAADYVLGRLGPQDRCAIVAYGSDAVISHTLSSDHKAGRRAVRRLGSMGGTAMEAGLRLGVDAFTPSRLAHHLSLSARRDGAEGGRQRYLFLLSDGHANIGVFDPHALADIAAGLSAQHDVVMATFGVGYGFNENLMEQIATSGGGGYWYIDQAHRIPEIFAGELTDMLAVTLAHTIVTLKASKGVTVEAVVGAGKVDDDLEEVSLGAIPAGGHREIAVKVTMTGRFLQASGQKSLLAATLTATNPQSDEELSSTSRTKVTVTSSEKKVQAGVDGETLAACLKLESADIEMRASRAADRGDFDLARTMVTANHAYLSSVATSMPAAAPMLVGSLGSLELSSAELDNYDAQTAKQMKFRSYGTRNSRG